MSAGHQESRNTMVVAEHRDRLPWIDLARGFCIILVVMMHFDEIHYANLDLNNAAESVWDTLTSVARPARMPTFFFISGFLASRSLDRPLSKVWDNRIGLLYYVYLIWSFISIAVLWMLFRDFESVAAWDFMRRLGSELIFPQTQIWFLYCLIAFFGIARLLRRWPVQTLVIALTVSAFSEHIEGQVLSQMIRLLPYYLTGIYFPALFLSLASKASPLRILLLFLCYIIAMAPLLWLEKTTVGIWIPASIVGIALIINIARVISSLPGSLVLEFIGRNTLPIYVMHSSALIAINTLANPLILDIAGRAGSTAFAYCYPMVGNIVLIALCMATHTSLRWLGMGWLFSLPNAMRREGRTGLAPA